MLPSVIKERNVLRTVKSRKANWIGYVLRMNCLIKDVSEGKIKGRIKVTGSRGRRRTELLGYLKETRGYWKLKEDAVDCAVGEAVGEAVGGAVGEALGEAVGEAVGEAAGEAVGEAVDLSQDRLRSECMNRILSRDNLL
jgi:hypothetical protein